MAPQANFTTFGGGRGSDVAEFELQLAALQSRAQQASPAMFKPEIATGATDRPLTHDASRLDEVLVATLWRHFVAVARMVFGSVAALRSALADAAQQWVALEYATDIEQAVYYLDQVEFGRVDHALAIEHRLLRSRFALLAPIESPQCWRALHNEFERWRQELFRLNSAGDLSDLANILDDKVISFLNELSGNASRNLDDWTLPHS